MIALAVISIVISIIGILYSAVTWATVREVLLEVHEMHKSSNEVHIQYYKKGLEDGMEIVMNKISQEIQERQVWSGPTRMDN